MAAGCAAELRSFCAFWAVRLLCRDMASEERIKTHLPFPLLRSGGGPSDQTALLDAAGPVLLPQFVLGYAGCVRSRTGVASRNRRLRWIFFLLFFDGLVHAYFHSSLSSLILSVPSSPEMLCPPIQSAPSTLAQGAASHPSLGAHHCPVSRGTDILK